MNKPALPNGFGRKLLSRRESRAAEEAQEIFFPEKS
jgi:hypothetical protein